jgi:thiamine kinase-like enzyme
MQASMTTFAKIFGLFIETIQKIEGLEEIGRKATQWDQGKLMVTWMSVVEPMRNGFRVLNHGDDWLNNIMLKSDENGNWIDAKLIDFQMSFMGSPASDLWYFLVSSIADDVKVEHFDALLFFYHNELVDSLNQLKYDGTVPTIADLHIDMLEKCMCRKFQNQNQLFNLELKIFYYKLKLRLR